MIFLINSVLFLIAMGLFISSVKSDDIWSHVRFALGWLVSIIIIIITGYSCY